MISSSLTGSASSCEEVAEDRFDEGEEEFEEFIEEDFP
jgi:hypothetical protein